MPSITDVELQKTSRSKVPRYNIYIDNKFAFGADEDLVVSQRLVKGKQLSKDQINELTQKSQDNKLLIRMYGLFSIRQRSEKEVRDYLKILNSKLKIKDQELIADSTVESVIDQLKSKGLINDLEFAKSWVEARRRSKKKGAQALKAELIQKGIDRAIIDQVLSSDVDEESLAMEAIQKKLPGWSKLDKLTFKKKLFGFLMRRGFSYEVAQSIWQKLNNSS